MTEARHRRATRYLHVRTLPSDKDDGCEGELSTSSVFNLHGWTRWWPLTSRCCPIDRGTARHLDVSFSAPRRVAPNRFGRGVIAAIQPKGSNDVIMLVSSATSVRWKKGADKRGTTGRELHDSHKTDKNPRAFSPTTASRRGRLTKSAGDTT